MAHWEDITSILLIFDIKSQTDGENPEKLFVDVSNTSHLIDGLLPFMEYYVSIVAFTDSGDGVPAEKTFTTLEGCKLNWTFNCH